MNNSSLSESTQTALREDDRLRWRRVNVKRRLCGNVIVWNHISNGKLRGTGSRNVNARNARATFEKGVNVEVSDGVRRNLPLLTVTKTTLRTISTLMWQTRTHFFEHMFSLCMDSIAASSDDGVREFIVFRFDAMVADDVNDSTIEPSFDL